MKEYDYLVVGAGIFGATVAERLASANKKILVIDKRKNVAGNIYSYTDEETKIEVHEYGSHIFHTEIDEVWNYITRFAEFNDYVHMVNTRHNGKLYPMPINLDTINLLYGTNMDAKRAKEFILRVAQEDMKRLNIVIPRNFEEKAISMVGEKLYNSLIKHYTEKQWNTLACNLPAEILSRIPIRFSCDNRYFMTAKYQGIPKLGYTNMISSMLSSKRIDIKLGVNFKDIKYDIPDDLYIIYCGQVDELLDYKIGVLPWRSLRFKKEKSDATLKQAVINEADDNVPYTRTHDFKYYQTHQPGVIRQSKSIIMREYPMNFKRGKEAYYPVNDVVSEGLYKKYVKLCREKYPRLILGGRLGAYRYWDMDKSVLEALKLAHLLSDM